MSKRRVVITGLGWVTPLGTEVDSVFNALLEGQSGIQTITNFDTSDYAVKIGGQVSDWDGLPAIAEGPERIKTAKRLDRFVQFSLNSAIDAVNDSGLDFSHEDPWRCGSIIGTGVGGMKEFCDGHEKLRSKGPSRVSPFVVPKMMFNAASGNVSIHFGIKGPNFAVGSACAAAGHAIGVAFDTVRYGQADVMVAGGTEAALNRMGLACFQSLKALSKRNDDPTRASRPWDKDRDGFILSEGAGTLVLEEYEHAKARGAKIYAEVLGWGQSADGGHITAPLESGAGAAQAMIKALRDTGVSPSEVNYINAHGTSTELGDLAETRAIQQVFGADTPVWVSSTKSMTGHALGAAGGIEAVICAKAIANGAVPPTINLDNPSEGCTLDYVANTARKSDLGVVLNNSFGFGGHNVSLAFGSI